MAESIIKIKTSWIKFYSFASKLIYFTREYASYFALRGISASDIDALDNLLNECINFPDDYKNKIYITDAVKIRNEHRKNILKQAKNLSGYILQEYGSDSEEYKQLEMSRIYNAKDSEKVALALDLIRIARELLPVLSGCGLTALMIDNFEAAVDLYEEKIDAVRDLKVKRKQNTQIRTSKYNELYREVVKFATIGKILAEEYREVPYEAFVIYPNQKKKKSEEPAVTDEG